jgi:hypothetical protein
VSSKESDVNVILGVDPHGLAGPERKALQLGPNQKMWNSLKKHHLKLKVKIIGKIIVLKQLLFHVVPSLIFLRFELKYLIVNYNFIC